MLFGGLDAGQPTSRDQFVYISTEFTHNEISLGRNSLEMRRMQPLAEPPISEDPNEVARIPISRPFDHRWPVMQRKVDPILVPTTKCQNQAWS
jgi:hypothetical protein